MERLHFETGVELVPFGLLAAKVTYMSAQEKVVREVRIQELSEEGFIYRMADDFSVPEKIELYFYHFEKNGYETVLIAHPEVANTCRFLYGTEVMIVTDLADYRQEVTILLREYYRYIKLKQEGDDTFLSNQYTGYPVEELYAKDFWEQRQKWSTSVVKYWKESRSSLDQKERVERWDRIKRKENIESQSILEKRDIHLAIQLDRRSLWEDYLSEPAELFKHTYFLKNGLEIHPLIKARLSGIYVGNAWCPHLFPEDDVLYAVMQKAYEEGVAITIVTTYLSEGYCSLWEKRIAEWFMWCQERRTKIEVVVNDWGMAGLLVGKEKFLEPVLGTLLNKYRKDPRFAYKNGGTSLCGKNALSRKFYRDFLWKRFGIRRYEWESCGYGIDFPEGKNSLHVPYYQTNTSQFCTLYAMVTEGNRGRQHFVKKCPHYCEKYVFLYPKHLQMVGLYNSLFAFDERSLTEGLMGSNLAEKGVDRIVVNFL